MFEWPTPIKIDMETYSRRGLFQHFSNFEIPVTSRTLQIDVTKLKDYVDKNKLRFTLTLGFILTRASNLVPEMRHRIQDGELVDFNKVIPAFTVLSKEGVLYFAKGVYSDHFLEDHQSNLAITERASKGLDQISGPENQGQIFITNIPWYSFTSINHPYSSQNASIPLFSIGKMERKDGNIFAPLAIQSHHGLVDGYHVGKFLDIMNRHLDDPNLINSSF